jgi:hypothetical protein
MLRDHSAAQEVGKSMTYWTFIPANGGRDRKMLKFPEALAARKFCFRPFSDYPPVLPGRTGGYW